MSKAEELAKSLNLKRKPRLNYRARIECSVFEIRNKLHLSQCDVAKAIGVHQTQLSKIELGISRPTVETALRIAEFFGKRVEELWKLNNGESQE